MSSGAPARTTIGTGGAGPAPIVLSAHRVGKAYDLRWAQETKTVRAMVSHRIAALRRSTDRRRWALRDISFELPAGRSLGLVGHNGAGKSTLLRLASGIGRPTVGEMRADPNTASVLNLGASFDDQLTGIENAFTAALIHGFSRKRARHAIDGIIDFSGLGSFASAPVRTYSEGMKLRLAFSVVTMERPALLVLDEVLAVGDMDFSERCAARISEMQTRGTSLLLASHSVEEIEAYCQEALWLHRGQVRARGDAATVIDRYANAMSEETQARTPVGSADDDGPVLGQERFGSQEMVIAKVEVRGSAVATDGAPVIDTGGRLTIALGLEARTEGISDPIVGMTIRRSQDELVVLDVNTSADRVSLGQGITQREVELIIDRVDLPAGEYTLDFGVYERSWEHAYDYHYAWYGLHVRGPTGGEGVMHPPRQWRLS